MQQQTRWEKSGERECGSRPRHFAVELKWAAHGLAAWDESARASVLPIFLLIFLEEPLGETGKYGGGQWRSHENLGGVSENNNT